jgi:hypothetical protein
MTDPRKACEECDALCHVLIVTSTRSHLGGPWIQRARCRACHAAKEQQQ